MDILISLANVAPVAAIMLLIAGTVRWLRPSPLAWIGAGMAALAVPGVVLTWLISGALFEASGGVCRGETREIMENYQYVYLAQAIFGVLGSAVLGGLAIRRKLVVGLPLALVLVAVSLLTGWFIVFAGAMTAVDGLGC